MSEHHLLLSANVPFNARGVKWLWAVVLSIGSRADSSRWQQKQKAYIPGPLPFPLGGLETWSLRPALPCSFICPGSQAPAVFVQIRVRLLYKPHSSFTGHPAAAPLASPAGPCLQSANRPPLTSRWVAWLQRWAQQAAGRAGNRKLEAAHCFWQTDCSLGSLSLKTNK